MRRPLILVIAPGLCVAGCQQGGGPYVASGAVVIGPRSNGHAGAPPARGAPAAGAATQPTPYNAGDLGQAQSQNGLPSSPPPTPSATPQPAPKR